MIYHIKEELILEEQSYVEVCVWGDSYIYDICRGGSVNLEMVRPISELID